MNRKELVIVAIVIFLTMVAWVVFGIYHAKTSSTLPASQLRSTTPLTPNFDNDIINQLKNRQK